jgi:hypothetical protein
LNFRCRHSGASRNPVLSVVARFIGRPLKRQPRRGFHPLPPGLLSFACPKESNQRKGHPGGLRAPFLERPTFARPQMPIGRLRWACQSLQKSRAQNATGAPKRKQQMAEFLINSNKMAGVPVVVGYPDIQSDVRITFIVIHKPVHSGEVVSAD